MKKNQLLTSAIVFGVLLSSCGSLSVSKMRYTKGLNIGLFSAKEAKPEEIKAKKAEKKQSNSVLVADNELKNEENKLAKDNIFLETNAVVSTQNSTENVVEKKSKNANGKSISIKKINKAVKLLKNSQSNTSLNHQFVQSNGEANESGLPVLLLVIMCLIPLLGLLAIYLHDGEIGTPFWIAFILYLLFILPGVIYSILVVVDAI